MNSPVIYFLAFILLILSIKKPFVGIFILLVLSTRIFYLIEMTELPVIKLIGVGDVQLYDLFLGVMLIASIIKIKRKQQEILFINIYIWLIILVTLTFTFSMFSDDFELRSALNSVRKLFSYTIYFVIIANIQVKEDISKLFKVIFSILIIAIAIQFYEVISGTKLVLIDRPELRLYWDISPEIGLSTGEQALYIWNRAVVISYIGLFIAFGFILTEVKTIKLLKNTNKIIFILGIITFILALTRSWMIFITLGLLISLLSEKGKKTKLIILSLGFTLVYLMVSQVLSFYTSENIDATQNLVGRVLTIFDVFSGSNDSFNIRLLVYATQFALFLESPIWGYGFTYIAINEINGDVGFGNTLLQFGLLGLSWVFFVIFSIYNKLFFLRWSGKSHYSRGISVGLLGAFSGMILGYFFNWDFFGRVDGIVGVVTILAIVDRVYYFENNKHI